MSNYRGQGNFIVRFGLQGAAKNAYYNFGGTVTKTTNYAGQFIKWKKVFKPRTSLQPWKLVDENYVASGDFYVVMGILVLALGRWRT
jgi:hypothetical protein